MLDIVKIGLMKRCLRQYAGNTPICDNLVEFGNLTGDIRRLVLTILVIHGAHNDKQLIGRLRINQELSIGTIIDLPPNEILDNLDIRGTEERLVHRCRQEVSLDGVGSLGVYRGLVEPEPLHLVDRTRGRRSRILDIYAAVEHLL